MNDRAPGEAGGRRAPTNRQAGPRRPREDNTTTSDRESDHWHVDDDPTRCWDAPGAERHVSQIVLLKIKI